MSMELGILAELDKRLKYAEGVLVEIKKHWQSVYERDTARLRLERDHYRDHCTNIAIFITALRVAKFSSTCADCIETKKLADEFMESLKGKP